MKTIILAMLLANPNLCADSPISFEEMHKKLHGISTRAWTHDGQVSVQQFHEDLAETVAAYTEYRAERHERCRP